MQGGKHHQAPPPLRNAKLLTLGDYVLNPVARVLKDLSERPENRSILVSEQCGHILHRYEIRFDISCKLGKFRHKAPLRVFGVALFV